jgi:hypothetical protein
LKWDAGQNNTTVCLAERVGPRGRIVAAGADYGTPETLGASIERIAGLPVGSRIRFRFRHDLARDEVPGGPFDYVVFAHCAWYLGSTCQLTDTLRAARRYAPILCVSEWDPRPYRIEQLGHFLAAQVQGTLAAFSDRYTGNIHLPITREALSAALAAAGWQIERIVTVDEPGLEDTKWEMKSALSLWQDPMLRSSVPEALLPILRTQIELMSLSDQQGIFQPLTSYVLRACLPEKSRADSKD